MLTIWDDLQLDRARQLRSWEEIVKLYSPRGWQGIKTSTGRMSFSQLQSDHHHPHPIGRMLALVAMENAQAPEESWPSGSLIGPSHFSSFRPRTSLVLKLRSRLPSDFIFISKSLNDSPRKDKQPADRPVVLLG